MRHDGTPSPDRRLGALWVLAFGLLIFALSIPPRFDAAWWLRVPVFLALLALTAWIGRAQGAHVGNTRLEALVHARTQELEAAQDRLVRREKLAVLGELAGSVAHELRNPLAVIKNSAFFLRMTLGTTNAKVVEHLALIDRKLEVSNRIITELLNWGRAPQPEIEQVALQKVIEEELADLGIPREVQLERALAPEPVRIDADPGQIGRIVGNLLRNALQAMPEGGTLTLGCEHQDGEALLTVSDTGVGIAEENRSKIFEPLYTSKAKGIGLGLPVCQRYAQANHGRLECESHLGEGSTFRLILPLTAAEAPAPASSAS